MWVTHLFKVAVGPTCCCSQLCPVCYVLIDNVLVADISSASHMKAAAWATRASDCGVWTSVTPHLCRWSPDIQMHNSCKPCVAAGPESVSVQPAHSQRHASTVMHDRCAGEATSIINQLLQNEYQIWKNQSSTSLGITGSNKIDRNSNQWSHVINFILVS